MDIDTPIEQMPFVGEAYAKKLDKLGIHTVKDLLYHLPSRHEDTSQVIPIKDIPKGIETPVTIKGRITAIETIYTRYGKKLTQAIVEDESADAEIIWFNQPYLAKALPVGSEVLMSGKVSFENYVRAKFVSPSYELVKGEHSIHLGKLTPIYPETKGISSKWLRTRIHETLQHTQIQEWLPDDIRSQYSLLSLSDALKSVHFPSTMQDQEKGFNRIAFDEMLLIQLLMTGKRIEEHQESAVSIGVDHQLVDRYSNALPFHLTQSQNDAISEVLADIDKNTPMHRLLEGEVGSGKTVVAGAAIYATMQKGLKAGIMAPTSILAKQHYDTFIKLFGQLGIEEKDISLVTGKSKPQTSANLFIGTQALLFQDNIINNLALVIIDEQHRFGVRQREKIVTAEGKTIHALTMSATPIPRTLALSIYGDLDISYLQELPKGRKAIMTRIVSENKRDDLYTFVKQELDAGHQAFIVCPLISLSDKLNVKSAQEEYQRLQQRIFPTYKLALLHGQMKSKEKDDILLAFQHKEYDILVTTPVVEVGIDIPNATIMLIEGSERFGLAQLHQLRGRVGRGEAASYCFLLTTNPEAMDIERLHVFATNSSGLDIAQFDLQNRGPGEVYGIRQSGIPVLKAASLLDIELIKTTRDLSENIYQKGLSAYPQIDDHFHIFKQEIQLLH